MDGSAVGMVSLCEANGALGDAALDLRQTMSRRLAHALDRMALGVCIYDENDALEFCNARFELIYRLGPMAAGTSFREMLERSVAVGNFPGRTTAEVWQERRSFVALRQSGTMLQHLGDGRLIAIGHEPLEHGGWIATYEDVTERRRAEMKLKFTAEHDLLTLLPNRLLFRQRLGESLAGIDRGGSTALLYLDLDGFKPVNDSYGHAAGDALLQQLAERLNGALRGSDVAARLGGDEFAVLLPGAGLPAASALAERLVKLLSAPYELGTDPALEVGVSIGIACAPMHARSGDDLMQRADEALYAAKRTARGRACVAGEYRGDAEVMGVPAPGDPGTLAYDLRAALTGGGLKLHYQPIVSCTTGDPVAYEALLRWNDPERGSVPPSLFIPAAEASGMIGPLTAWVLDHACGEAKHWDVQLNVNLSPISLADPDLLATVKSILDRHGFDPTKLVLEITETARLSNSPVVGQSLERLAALGIKLWLDDFGTGFANISMLRSIPFSAVKVDRSFLADGTARGIALLRNLLAFARACELDVVVEGVELPAQVSRLRTMGCDWLQGFLLGRPDVPSSFPLLRSRPV